MNANPSTNQNCSRESYPWNRWLQDALEAGIPEDLATLGRATIREAYQHTWSQELKYLTRPQLMIRMAQDAPKLAACLWTILLETDGLRHAVAENGDEDYIDFDFPTLAD